MLAYLVRYNHRVAMATMALAPAEFIRRFLMHVLPSGFHRIRHYGLLAKGPCAVPLDRLRALILDPAPKPTVAPVADPPPDEPASSARTCPGCGCASLRIIEVIGRGGANRAGRCLAE